MITFRDNKIISLYNEGRSYHRDDIDYYKNIITILSVERYNVILIINNNFH